MTTIALDKETSNYWNYIKKASDKEKLTLIALLSSSLADGNDAVKVETKPLKARRLNALSDEEMENLMQGDSVPVSDSEDTELKDIVEANSGRLTKGLEKWL